MPVSWPAAGSFASGINLTPTVNGACSLAGAATGCAILGMPAALIGQKFKVIVSISDQAGNIAVAASAVLNGPSGLTLFAGADSSILGGTALSTALTGDIQGLARDPFTGDIFLLRNGDILKVQGSSGIITKWAGSAGSGASTVTVNFSGTSATGLARVAGSNFTFDSVGNLYWTASTGIFKWLRGSSTASLVAGIPSAAFKIVNDKIYYSTSFTINCGAGCSYVAYRIFQYNADTTSTLRAGQDYTQALVFASEGAAASSILIGRWTVTPITSSTEKIWFFNHAKAYNATALYSVANDGNVYFEVNRANTEDSHLSPYILSRNSFAIYDSAGGTITLMTADAAHGTTSITTFNGALRNIVDGGNQGLFTLNLSQQIISYYSSTNVRSNFAGALPSSGDGGHATFAELRSPGRVASDSAGNIFIVDTNNNRLRKVDTANTITSTNWGPNWSVSTSSIVLANGAPPSMLISSGSGLPYQTNAFGTTGVKFGIVNITGACQFICGNASTANFAPTTTSTASPQTLSSTPDSANTYIMGNHVAFDQANYYVYMREFSIASGGVYRSYIKKINSSLAYTEVAGNNAAAFVFGSPSAIVAGQTISGNTAGAVSRFRAANAILYPLQAGILYSGTEGGSWIQQVASGSISGFVVDKRGSADPLQSMIYFTKTGDTRLYRKPYTAIPGVVGEEVVVVDFTGALTAPILAELDPVQAKTFYLTDGNSVYKYNNFSLP